MSSCARKIGWFARHEARCEQLLMPDCQLIADSSDLRVGADETRLAELERKATAGRYFGETDLRFEYMGRSGAPFSTLQVDYETLARIAERSGWSWSRATAVTILPAHDQCETEGPRGRDPVEQ